MRKEEKVKELSRLRGALLEVLRIMREMESDIGAPFGQTDVPTEQNAFAGYLSRAKELCPDNERIQSTVVPSGLLGEVFIAYRALSDFLGWEIETLQE